MFARTPGVRKLFDGSGRLGRLGFLLTGLIPIVIVFSLVGLYVDWDVRFFDIGGLTLLPLILLAVYVAVVATIRRLHDLGKSGWFTLLWLIPIPLVSIVFVLYLLFAPGVTKWEVQGRT